MAAVAQPPPPELVDSNSGNGMHTRRSARLGHQKMSHHQSDIDSEDLDVRQPRKKQKKTRGVQNANVLNLNPLPDYVAEELDGTPTPFIAYIIH